MWSCRHKHITKGTLEWGRPCGHEKNTCNISTYYIYILYLHILSKYYVYISYTYYIYISYLHIVILYLHIISTYDIYTLTWYLHVISTYYIYILYLHIISIYSTYRMKLCSKSMFCATLQRSKKKQRTKSLFPSLLLDCLYVGMTIQLTLSSVASYLHQGNLNWMIFA